MHKKTEKSLFSFISASHVILCKHSLAPSTENHYFLSTDDKSTSSCNLNASFSHLFFWNKEKAQSALQLIVLSMFYFHAGTAILYY